ncbi:MAG: DUF484 family protein [Neisseriales bacterium]|nr:MAG: DUF484 family protein [Neisseriales bacterium]
MQENEVLAYLVAHPAFLMQHAPQFGLSPKLNDVMALSEKQLSTLRGQHQQLKLHLDRLQANATLNDTTQQHLHALTLALLSASDLNALIRAIDTVFGAVFNLPYIALKLWHPHAKALPNYFQPTEQCKQSLNSLNPTCAHYIRDELLAWLPSTTTFQSFAILPLMDSHQAHFGLLLIGSEDPERFSPDLHNHYLQKMDEQISVALLRFLV